ncbi:MAG: hypothetical protein JW849_05970 [Phycisphaerae bacterium]|nr:hypothetical protein [Phycisphaerae bacterium]
MTRPVVLCAADLAHSPKAREILENACKVLYTPATPEALQEHLPEADAYLASLHVQLTKELIEKSPRLKAIATPSTGLDHIDIQATKDRGIAVLGLKDDREFLDRITSTAELAWGLLLACVRRIPEAFASVREGQWGRDRYRGRQLTGKTLGILGCGRLGTIVSQYGLAFRMNVIGNDVRPVNLPGVRMVSFDELISRSDVLSIHIHLTPENRRLIDRDVLKRMKPGAVLINTSRGAILDESALLEALQTGNLTAGLDVIEGEWDEQIGNHPLVEYARTHENLIITPHVGGVTHEAQEMAYARAAEKLVAYFSESAPRGS